MPNVPFAALIVLSATALAPRLAVAAPETAQPAPLRDATSFEACRADLGVWAGAHGVPSALAREQLATLSPDPDVLAATGNQGEFVKPIWSYIDAGVTGARIADGQRKLAEWASALDAIERRYGVDRFVLAAFWGVESSYGAVLDDPGIVKPVVRSLATLACKDPARAGYWRDELTAALTILAQGEAPAAGPAGPSLTGSSLTGSSLTGSSLTGSSLTGSSLTGSSLTGSWAGAMGHTQFMPSVYRAQAVDFDGDGRRDIWTSVPDALASTANYLRAIGWRPGEPWGFEVALPATFDLGLADETTSRSLAAWRALGVVPAQERPAGDADLEATLILPAGARGPAFLLGANFRSILRYNTSLSYALTVGHLADRLRGGAPFSGDWPRGDRVLTVDERRDVQGRLTERGFPVGGVDGKFGPKTRAAVRAYQGSVGLPPDGYPDAALLERIRTVP